MAASYDPQVIRKFADMMYLRADVLVVLTTILVALGGGVMGGSMGDATGFLLGAFLAAGLGYLLGQSAAFWFRLGAQAVLCLVQIEENSRARRSGGPLAPASDLAGAVVSAVSAPAPAAPLPPKEGPRCRKRGTVAPVDASRCSQCLEKLVA